MAPQRPCAAVVSWVAEQFWGVQDSIGLVPGQDPDLSAPALRVACVREISIQLQPQTKGGKKNDKILVRVMRWRVFNVYLVYYLCIHHFYSAAQLAGGL